MRKAVDVEPSRGDVGRHQHAHPALLEARERADPRALALVAVHRDRRHMCALELLHELVGTVLRACEYEHLLPATAMDELCEQSRLAVSIDAVNEVIDVFRGAVSPRHLDEARTIQQPIGERLDGVGERSAEKQVLPPPWQQGHQALDVVDETHVEHAVRLVQHEYLDLPEVDGLARDVVEQPSGCRHHDVATGAQGIELRAHADAAENRRAANRDVRPVGAKALPHLKCKLARRNQDQPANGAEARERRRRCHQALQQRQREARGLSGAGLGGCQQIFTPENGRDGLTLHGGGCVVALLVYGTQQLGFEAKGFECQRTYSW